MADALELFAETVLPSIDQAIDALIAENTMDGPDDFAGMLRYQFGMVDPSFRPVHTRSGKKIRPLLCLLCSEASCSDWKRALPAAVSLEVLHNYTLVHDDIEDGSRTRRGRPTHWALWGEGPAINVGDAMYALSIRALSMLDSEVVDQALASFSRSSLVVTRGQHLDMCFEKKPIVTVDEYMDMISCKTAALIALSCELGALAGGASKDVSALYAHFGHALGLAFQIKDDILGIWGIEESTGKSAQSDISTRKKTLPVIYGLSHSRELAALYSSGETGEGFVKQASELLEAAGALSFSEAMAAEFSNKALMCLNDACQAGSAPYEALHDLVTQMLSRKH